jgi:circadian clock protein KaiB
MMIDKEKYLFHLFIAGTTANSSRAIVNIKEICEQCLKGRYKLLVIDIYQSPSFLISEQIIAMPLLIRKHPLPEKIMIGDLSDTNLVLKCLDLKLLIQK